MSRLCYFAAYLCLIGNAAICPAAAQTDSSLVVGVKEAPPFIVRTPEGSFEGLSILLWEEIAKTHNLRFSYQELTLQQIEDSLRSGSVDLCISPFTVTAERIRRLNFSQPFYVADLAIAARKSSSNHLMAFFANLFSWEFLRALFVLMAVLLIVGMLVWLAERGKNEAQFGRGISGLFDGFWWSAVTMTTVGYGDKTPATTGGRLIGLVWMFAAIITISSFTASIATSLTVSSLDSRIRNIDDLKGEKAGTVVKSSSATFLKSHHLKFHEYLTIKEAIKALNQGEIDFLIYDRPILSYFIHQMGLQKDILLIQKSIHPQYYGFSSAKGSTIFESLNPEILEFTSSSHWEAEVKRYIPE